MSQRAAAAPAGERPGAVQPAPTQEPTSSPVSDGLISRPEAEVPSSAHEARPGQRLVVSKSTSETIDAPRTSAPRAPVSPSTSAPRSAAAPGSVRPATAPGGQRPGVPPLPVTPRAPAATAPIAPIAPAPAAAHAPAAAAAAAATAVPGPVAASQEGTMPTALASTAVSPSPSADHKVGAPRPVSPSGKPIPPPPGPRSVSGRPIPPPPGARRPLPPGGPSTRPAAPGTPPGCPGHAPGGPGHAAGDEPVTSWHGRFSATGWPASEPPARSGHRLHAALLVTSRPETADALPAAPTEVGEPQARVVVAAIPPVVRRVPHVVVLSGADVRPSGGPAAAAATWRSSNRSR